MFVSNFGCLQIVVIVQWVGLNESAHAEQNKSVTNFKLFQSLIFLLTLGKPLLDFAGLKKHPETKQESA